MAPHFFWIGILGLVAIAACWALAVVLYRVGTPGSTARKLAFLLVVEGVVLVTAQFPEYAFELGENLFEQYPVLSISSFMLHHIADAAMIVFYPLFLAAALQTKLTRIFIGKRVRVSVTIIAIVLSIAPAVTLAFWESPAGSFALYIAVTLLFIYALMASIQAWRSAPEGLPRDRARIFAIAFGARDVGWVISYATFAWMLWADNWDLLALSKTVYALGTLLAVPLIAYGILRSHLFDIDLRIQWTIKQSTLAGLIVAIIFLISEGASEFLSAELGTVAGLLAAAVVIFFLAPLQRFAERVAASAMPNTENTPEYVAFRKMQVYEEALIEALEEGGISPKERSLLKRLRESLEISETDAEAIEGEVQNRLAAKDGPEFQPAH